MELAQGKPGSDSIQFSVPSRTVCIHSTHFQGERVDVAGLRAFGVDKPETLRVDKFGGGTIEEPVDVGP